MTGHNNSAMSSAITGSGEALTVLGKIGWLAVAAPGAPGLWRCWPAAGASRSTPPGWSPAALSTYAIAYRFYSKFIATRVLRLDPARIAPAVRHEDGLDYVPTNRFVLFGHHFAAIAGAGPLVGPVLAAQMGYLPGTLLDSNRRRFCRRGARFRHTDPCRRGATATRWARSSG